MHGKADIFLDGTTLAIPLYVTRGAVPRGTPPHRLCSGLTHSFPSQHLVTEDTLCRAPCRELGRKGDWGPGLPPGRVRRSAASPGPRDRRALRAGGPANCQAQGLPQVKLQGDRTPAGARQVSTPQAGVKGAEGSEEPGWGWPCRGPAAARGWGARSRARPGSSQR